MTGGGTSINFGDNAKIDTLATGENAVVDKSQGKTIVQGDMYGDVANSFGNVRLNSSQFVDALKSIFSVEAVKFDTVQLQAENAVEKLSATADTPESTEAASAINTLAATANPDEVSDTRKHIDEVFQSMSLLADEATPQSEDVESSLSKFKNLVLKRGPVFGKALLNGVVAVVQTQIAKHPIVAGVCAFLETFKTDAQAADAKDKSGYVYQEPVDPYFSRFKQGGN